MDPDDRSVLLEQAFGYLRVPDDCREDAEFWILDIARVFRERHASERQDPPRLANLSKQTAAIENHAAQLAHLLDETDPYFAQAAAAYLGFDEWNDDQGVSLFEIRESHRRTQLIAELQRLATFAGRLRKALPRDTGGQKDLLGIFEGPSTWTLAVNCWELFDWFRPGEATGNVNNGDYHVFVEIVYSLAVQKEANSGLTVFTKRAARLCNAYAERTPGYRNLRRARPPGNFPAGRLTGSGIAADLYGVPAKLRDEIAPRKPHR